MLIQHIYDANVSERLAAGPMFLFLVLNDENPFDPTEAEITEINGRISRSQRSIQSKTTEIDGPCQKRKLTQF